MERGPMERMPIKRAGWPYAAAILLVALATAVGHWALHHVDPPNLVMLYLLVVVVVGLRWGQGPAVLSAVLGVLAFDYFLVPPYLTLAVSDAQYIITFIALLAVALTIGTLTGLLRDRAAELDRHEKETSTLYAFSRSMVMARDLPAVARAVVGHVNETFGRPATLLLRDENGTFAEYGSALSPGLRRRAEAALGQGQPPAEDWVPLTTAHGVVGILLVDQPAGAEPLEPEQRRLLEALAVQAGVVVERARLVEAAQRARLLEEADKLHDALLHSISHGLRTPLSSIIGSLSTLADEQALDAATRTDLLETAREEAERLNWLVSNLLDMTRLESGHLKLTRDEYDLEDVVGVALGQTSSFLKGRPVRVEIDEGLPLVNMDQVLIVQVLDNLLVNAVKYSPAGLPVEIGVRRTGAQVEIRVADRGVGIPASDRERIFEKFYRVERPGNPSGTGLGLAICRGIVEAHHGRIWAEPRDGGGTILSFTLPLEKEERT